MDISGPSPVSITDRCIADIKEGHFMKTFQLTSVILCALFGPLPATHAQTISAGADGGYSIVRLSASANMPPAAANASFTPFSASGISLVPYGSPAFVQLLKASLPDMLPASTLAVLPYSVFVVNASAKPIIAVTVGWTSLDDAGQPNVDYRTVWDVIHLAAVVAPNSASLATIIGPVSAASLAGQPAFGDGQEQASVFQAQASVTVALDAVVFPDGTSLGPVRSQSVAQMMTRLRAERDLYTMASSNASTQSVSALTSWLQTLSDQAKPGAKLSLGSGADPGWYVFYQARIGDSLMRFVNDRGVDAALAYVRSVLATKPYPPLQ
jgi:hypothetical protein